MELNIKPNKSGKMERKKFFYSIGLGFIGTLAVKNIILNFFTKKIVADKSHVSKNTRVKINPLAVRRNKTGTKNV